MRTYREVLADGDFGELYVGGQRPERWKHVFASVQSLTSYGVANIPPDAFDIVVIDEFHHAKRRRTAGSSTTSRPRSCSDSPPHLNEPTALTSARVLRWPHRRRATAVGRAGRRPALPVPLLRHRRRHRPAADHAGGVARLRRGPARPTSTPATTRARASSSRRCSDKIADVGRDASPGLLRQRRARRVHGSASSMTPASRREPSPGRRRATSGQLRCGRCGQRTVNVLFTVDLFNEGLDIPDVDTVLFLRPTESATSSCSSSGADCGGRSDKAVLTVLDFVGYHRKEFRFVAQVRRAHRHPRQAPREGRQGGLPLPALGVPGASRQADARGSAGEPQVPDRQPLGADRGAASRHQGRLVLEAFLESSGLELSDILRRGSHSWTKLRQDAGLETLPGSELEEKLLKRVRAFAHVDDPMRAAAYRSLLADESPRYAELSPEEQRIARMLYHSFWYDGGGFDSIEEGFDAMRQRASRARGSSERCRLELRGCASRACRLSLDL